MKRLLGLFSLFFACTPTSSTEPSLPPILSLGDSAGELVIGDLNADGLPDIGASSGSKRFLALNDAEEPFAEIFSSLLSPITLRSSMSMVSLGGKITLAVTGIDQIQGRNLLLLLDSVNGAAEITELEGDIPASPYHAFGDFDGDEDLDLVIIQIDTLLIYANEGDSFLTTPQVVPTPIPLLSRSLAVGDLDRDGRDDLVGTGGQGTAVFFGENIAAGPSLSLPLGVASDPASKVRVFDSDGDGSLELLTISSRSPILQSFSVSTKRTATLLEEKSIEPERLGVVLEGYLDVVPADLDADGTLDLAAIRLLSTAQGLTSDLAVLFGDNATNLFEEVRTTAEAPDLESADLDLDGLPELVLLDGSEISLFSRFRE